MVALYRRGVNIGGWQQFNFKLYDDSVGSLPCRQDHGGANIGGWQQFNFKLYAEKECSSVSNPVSSSCSNSKSERHHLALLDRKPCPKQLQKMEVNSKEVLRLRTARFWVITQSVVVISYRHFATIYRSHLFGFLTPDDGTDRLSRNDGKKLPLLAAW